ncbi:MAG: hydrophobe/amphiphile efflux-1 family RND transporter [Candidatus Puniceispirillum sp.]|nr:hydrophobe/amphiphile efflux-1 family RND transporter [Candidatus Puniceispirillum sp.]
MAQFFIDRPVFAWVIAIVIMLAGVMSISRLPIEQYPKIAPPTVTITANYPGASAQTIENGVTQIIEQQMKGLDYLRYFASSSQSSGTSTITLTFEPEANPDIAQVQVQNKLQAAMSLLPQEVQKQGVTVTKSNGSFLLVLGFYAETDDLSQYKLQDFVVSKIVDPISRIEGVGSTTVFAQQYAMRIWLNADKLNSYGVSVADVSAAITAQNADVSAGQLGGAPAREGQQLNATITVQTRLKTVPEFENIFLRVNKDGSQIRLKDVARVELGPEAYSPITRYMRRPAAGVGISLATGANALETADRVRARMAELEPYMPEGMKVVFPYDTTPFVKLSLKSVVETLVEAVILVFCVMYLFLQSFRATLIPTIAVPIVLLGTFGVLSAFGFSINVLTMFGMVLAIGLLVDDAIVVVENVERVMAEEGLSPRDATKKSMYQITSALVGIALVLSAVFVPMAFFSGSTGAIYRQFSLTIVSAMVLSVLVALILTPALCASLLKPHEHKTGEGFGHAFFEKFNAFFERNRDRYVQKTTFVTQRAARFFAIYGVLIVGLIVIFERIPTAFLPDEDQGILFVMVQAPAGAPLERTLESMKKVEDYFLNNEQDIVGSMFAVTGWGFSGVAQNTGLAFVRLKDWKLREKPGQSLFDLVGRSMGALSGIKDASVFAFFPPPIIELGRASGFDVQILDRAALGHETLMKAEGQLLGMASQDKRLVGVRPNGLPDQATYNLVIDHERAQAQGVSIADLNGTLQTGWGSSYINDFLHEGRTKRVYLQGDTAFRMNPIDVSKWYVRNTSGNMVPVSTMAKGEWRYGSPKLERYNGTPSFEIQGAPAPGVSSGDAMNIMSELIAKLPKGVGYEWTGLSYEEREAGSQVGLLYSLSVLIVFLCLAALYESWSVPFAVILVVPLGILGAVAATWAFRLSNDVYFQVGLLTTIGLSAKNAILIVAFAKEQHDRGVALVEATLHAAKQRLRPIIMTSFAFILGVTPLAVAKGAGSASQNAIGTGVIGGMIAATFLAIFFVPLFFISIHRFFDRKSTSESEG